MAELTGNKRFRSGTEGRLFPRPILILQVEVSGLVDYNMGGYIECEVQTWWRDASTEDLLELKL